MRSIGWESTNLILTIYIPADNSFKPPVRNSTCILQPNQPILLIRFKQMSNCIQHSRIPRMPRPRHIGRGNNPSGQRLNRKQLRIGKNHTLHRRGRKKSVNLIRSQMLPPHNFIIDTKLAQQPFISIVKAIATQATLVIDHRAPAIRSQNPGELSPRPLQIEPVQRLPNCYQIESVRRQSRSLCRAINTMKPQIPLDQTPASSPHFFVRFNRSHFETTR